MHNDAVIKECHLKMLTIELCPQGICDLVQQVALSFSAALPSAPTAALFLQWHFHSTALAGGLCLPAAEVSQRWSLSEHHPFPNTYQREKTPTQKSTYLCMAQLMSA